MELRAGKRGSPLIICPLLTPLTEAEEVDVPSLRRLVIELNDNVEGFMVVGTTGEVSLLRQSVVDEALRIVLASRSDGRLVVACVVATGTEIAVDLANHYGTMGTDYLAVGAPVYFGDVGDSALTRHFETVADRAPVPVLLYNIPSRTHLPISIAVTRELSRHPNIVGIKDSSGDWQHFTRLLALRKHDFAVFQGGTERLAVQSLRQGADGLVCGMENLAPGLMKEVRDAALDGGDEVLSTLLPVVELLAQATENGHLISSMKAALAARGIGSGRVARPLPSLSADDRQKVQQLMEEVSNHRRKVGLEGQPPLPYQDGRV